MIRTQRFTGLVLAIAMFASAPQANAEEAAAPVLPESQQLARQELMNMARFLAGLERFSVDIRGGYDAVQSDGLKIQFLESRQLTLVRPDRLVVRETRADGRDGAVFFDGKHVTVWDGAEQVYATAEQPDGIDDSIVYLTRDLGMRLPLAPLLTTRLPSELARRVWYAEYVETTSGPLFDVPAHHIVARTEAVDAQIWVAATGTPWPLRIVITYRDEPGSPDYWAEFSHWNARPKVDDAQFRFDPPEGSAQIDFAVQFVAGPKSETGGEDAE